METLTEYKGYTTVKTESGETLYGRLVKLDAGDLAYLSRDRKTGEVHHAYLGQILGLYKTNEQMNTTNPEEKAKEMVSVILKALQKENDPITPLLEMYIESELEKYRTSKSILI